MPEVWIVAPDVPVAGWTAGGFEAIGWSVRPMTYSYPQPRSLAGRAFRKFWGDPEAVLTRIFNALLREEVIPELTRMRCGLILVMMGHALDTDNYETLSRLKIPIALWTIDSADRFPGQLSLQPLAAHSFFMDGGDVRFPNSTWLPLGHDNRLPFPRAPVQDLDILFLGYLKQPQYRTRKRYFLQLCRSGIARKYKVAFLGTTGNRFEDTYLRNMYDIQFIGRTDYPTYLHWISRAKISVNIHQDDGISPVNPTFFAVPGVGGCQIAEDRLYLGQWLTPGQEYLPATMESFFDSIEGLLSDEGRRNAIAQAGRRAVQAHHTFTERAKHILNAMELH